MATKQLLRRLLREPLFHFLLMGGLLFALFEFVRQGAAEPVDESRAIVVTVDSLADFAQARAKAFAPEAAAALLNTLPPEELQRVIDEFVREEALYREAIALRLDEKDIGVRRRLIRQLEFINEGVVSSTITLTDQQLQEFLDEHVDQYVERPTITFTHVYFSADRHGSDHAQQLADSALAELNGGEGGDPVPFHRAPAFGDRFLYHQNYVKQDADEIASHFGEPMQQRVFALPVDEKTWHGPIASPYGFHLVLVADKTEQALPDFDKLRPRLQRDAFQSQLQREITALENAVVENYRVMLDDSLTRRLSEADATETGDGR